MKVPLTGAIDCDLHPAMPSAAALLPYLDDYWRDQITNRHIDRYSFVLTSYPPNSPLSARPDWRQASGLPGGDLEAIRRQALDPFGTRLRHLQHAARRDRAVQRGHGGGVVRGGERLGGAGAARP